MEILDQIIRLSAIPTALIPLLVAALDSYTLSHQFAQPDENRQTYLSLAIRLSDATLGWSTLIPLANTYGKRNRSIVSGIVCKGPTEELRPIVKSLMRQMENLNETKHLTLTHLDRISRLSHTLVCLVYTSDTAARIARDDLLLLGGLYTHMSSLLKRHMNTAEEKKYLNARLDLLVTASTCLQTYFPVKQEESEQLVDLMLGLLDLPEGDGEENSLIRDLECYKDVSTWFAHAEDERLGYIRSSLQGGIRGGSRKMLELLSGKEQTDKSLQEAIDSVQAVLPDQTTSFLTRTLPSFYSNGAYNTEKLIQSILEGTLLNPTASTFSPSAQPQQPKSDAVSPSMSPSSSFNPSATAFTPAQPASLLSTRSNIYDSQPLTSSHFIKRVEEDSRLSEEMKATILGLAEADSEEEYVEEDWDSRAISSGKVVVDEFDDYALAAQTQEDSDEEDVSSPFNERVIEVLSRAYMEHGLEVLLRNKGKPVTQARQGLMDQLQKAGWKGDGASDLIESWGKQLERDPKKQTRLAAFEWTGNRPSSNTPEVGPSNGQNGQNGQNNGPSNQRGRGQRGRGARGGDRGRGGGQRGAHQRRQRGHDKKTRGGMMG